MMRLIVAAAALAMLAEGVNRTVVVTGATGRTGSYTYLLLKKAGVNVRALVRSTSKAREYLGCSKCDESEGIFIGDITRQESMVPAMTSANGLVITTGKSGSEPAKDILFDGVANQVAAFLGSPGPKADDRHIALVSMQFTTLPDSILNKIIASLWGGWNTGFYSLQGEAHLMSANVPFTIVKACGLTEDPEKQNKIIVGHDDKGWSMRDAHTVSRHDLARVLASAATNPKMAGGLRFDFCSTKGTPQDDAMDIIKEAMQPWDSRKTQPSSSTVV
mmetsp:Transcript_36064/g.59337  ORF Transcript_36064/g.59337 Transcript_36064/m.59337 type:complete len:275 (-) Transcript_36064:70-894(-)